MCACVCCVVCVCVALQKSGIAIVSDVEREKTMVQELLELKAKVDGIIGSAFRRSPLFLGVVREGFESVVNRRQNKPAELIGLCVCVFYNTALGTSAS